MASSLAEGMKVERCTPVSWKIMIRSFVSERQANTLKFLDINASRKFIHQLGPCSPVLLPKKLSSNKNYTIKS